MTAPTPESPIDVEKLRLPQNARHHRDCAFQRWARRTDYTRPPDCDCDWPAILAALTELEGLRAEVARLLVLGHPAGPEIITRRKSEEWAYQNDFPAITCTLRAAREAEEASRG
jgi:hypothetical protein